MRFAAAFVILSLFAVAAARAQTAEPSSRTGDPDGPDSPAGAVTASPAKPALAMAAPVLPVKPVKPVIPAHKFLDLKNSMAISAFAAALTGDSYSTQRALAYPGVRERNPVAEPFVSSRGGEIAYSGAGFALFSGSLYLAHRTGHHKLERIAPWIATGWEGFLAGWNMHQVSLARSGH